MDKRQLFYLGKMLTEDKQYHKTYLLRDEEGRLFRNLLELYVITCQDIG